MSRPLRLGRVCVYCGDAVPPYSVHKMSRCKPCNAKYMKAYNAAKRGEQPEPMIPQFTNMVIRTRHIKQKDLCLSGRWLRIKLTN